MARQFGATTPFLRPRELADDFTGTNAVVRHGITWFAERGRTTAHACCIYATAPLLQARFIREGYERLRASDAAFAFSITDHAFPIQRSLRMTPDGRVDALYPEHRMTRSQDLEPAYHDAGQFYWGTAQAFLDDIPVFSSRSIGVVLPRKFVQDIDTQEDWEHAEAMYRAINSR